MTTHANRIAIVTGAARGIGQAICRGLAKRSVAAVIGVDLQDMSETREQVKSSGAQWGEKTLDVSNPAQVRKAAEEILQEFGRCDILVNNAGIFPSKAFDELTYDEWRRVMAVNVDSQFLMSRSFIASMKANNWGRIVNIGSSSVQQPAANFAAYRASKMAVIGLTRGMAADLGQYGITVNVVSPSLTATPGATEFGNAVRLQAVSQRQAIKRIAQPDDIVGTVLFLTSEDCAFVTGQTLIADGGLSFS
jgi:NAD(P)-dependent dehydrogenase (short-subunit alcohol dehydrogenase family)